MIVAVRLSRFPSVVTLILAATALTGPLPAVAGAPADGTPGHSGGSVRTVTLVTGDRISTVDGTDRVGIQPGPGRAGIGFVSSRAGGHLRITPTDALEPLRTGRLDPRLFDVTDLLASGYDDIHGDLPLIVRYRAGTAPRAALTGSARVVRDLPALDAVAVREPRVGAGALWTRLTGAAGVDHVWLDGRLRTSLDVSVPLIGAPIAWQAGYTGTGVAVAVLDTGIDDSHPDLAGKVTARQNFTTEDMLDHHGHGTHVASTIAGTGAASGGRYRGVAPDATLYDGKVCDRFGFCDESAILAGMQWAAADQHARIVNMSFGQSDTEGIDPMEQAVNDLTARYGTLFVVAAGNDGGDRTINTPGSADAALTVGATSKTDTLADFSSRGPRLGDLAVKPDLTAPGVDITAARSRYTSLGNPGDEYLTASGTSMATPHVAGSAALLAQRHPDWSATTLKATLMAAAKPNPDIGVFAQGAGRVDIGRGIGQTVVADPVSVSFGTQLWPHTGNTPVTKTVHYHNTGTAPATLALTPHTNGPAGMFTVTPGSITVAAGGDASVQVTADARVPGPAGFLGGELTATDGTTTVQTPIGLENEGEVYPLTIRHLGRDGKPTTVYSTEVFNLGPYGDDVYEGPDTQTIRLPKGRYAISSAITGQTGAQPWIAELVRPEVVLDHAQTITFDARTAKPVHVTVPSAKARPAFLDAGWVIGDPTRRYGMQVGTTGTHTVYTAQLGTARSGDRFTGEVNSQWAEPGPGGDAVDSPAVYLLAWFFDGRFPTGYDHQVATRDLATVKADYGSHVPGSYAEKYVFSVLPGRYERVFTTNLALHPPLRRVEYYNADTAAQREHTFIDDVAPDSIAITFESTGAPVAYRTGHTYHDVWNRAVFEPAFPRRDEPGQWVGRVGDTLVEYLRLYSDSGGHTGDAGISSGDITLTRDGVPVCSTTFPYFCGGTLGSQDEFPMVAGDATYRLAARSYRSAPSVLSTAVLAAWTFRSQHGTGAAPQVLPLSAIRFAPAVDATGTAPAGRPFDVPVTVQRQTGAAPAKIRTLTVDVSYDDGATWNAAPLTSTSNGGVVRLTHPTGTGYVSLRANLTDTGGSTAELTVIHAYRFR